MKLRNLFSRFIDQVPEGHKSYHGEYHGGQARFIYKPQGQSERIFNGPFTFDRKGGGVHDHAEGTFSMNRKEGAWTFERTTSHGRKQLRATFADGNIVGEAECAFEELGMTGGKRNVFSFHVVEGHLTGRIEGRMGDGEFSGQCDDDGMAHGEWTLTFNDEDSQGNTVLAETWEHGVLTDSVERHTGRKKEEQRTVRLCESVNYMLETVVGDLLALVRRGNAMTGLHVGMKK